MNLQYKNDNLSVNLIDKGQGDTIVLLHGWGARADIYMSIINLLSSKYRIIAPDLPGFGKTTEPSFAYDVKDYVDFVLLMLKELGISKASFIGHSHGGRCIIEMASRSDLKIEIDKIVLIDSAGIRPKLSFSKQIRIATYKSLKKIVTMPLVAKKHPDLLDKLKKKFGSADYSNSSEIMRQSMVKVVNSDFTDRLHLIKAPTLLIWGDKDTATPIEHAHIMQKKIPDAGLVTIKNGTHFSFADDFALTSRVLSSFFKL